MAARQQAVVRVWERERRQEGKGLATTVTDTAPDFNPVVMFIVSLLEAAAMPDDRVTFTNRAPARNDLGALCGPIGFQVDLAGGKWDKENRSNRGSARAVTLPRSEPEVEPSPPNKKNLNW
ncbi:MAG: hypothetical protein WCG85_00415, partial [Polyangia bacterium]